MVLHPGESVGGPPHICVGCGGGVVVAPLSVDGHVGPALAVPIAPGQRGDGAAVLHIAGVGARAQDDAYLGVSIHIAAARQRAH